MVKHILAIAVGGAIGAVLRFGVHRRARLVGRAFPYGTLLVNVLGSPDYGVFYVLLWNAWP